MVEGTYEKTTARVVVGKGASEEFEVKIGLRQGIVDDGSSTISSTVSLRVAGP